MSVKSTIVSQFEQVATEQERKLARLSDDTKLIECGLGSLSFAILGGRLEELRGRSVLLAMTDQLTAALAIAELDGVARRMVLLTPGLAAEHLPAVIAGAAADARVQDTDRSSPGREIGIGISVD